MTALRTAKEQAAAVMASRDSAPIAPASSSMPGDPAGRATPLMLRTRRADPIPPRPMAGSITTAVVRSCLVASRRAVAPVPSCTCMSARCRAPSRSQYTHTATKPAPRSPMARMTVGLVRISTEAGTERADTTRRACAF